MPTNPQPLDNISKLQNKHRRLNHIYRIIDKGGAEVFFKFNQPQELLWNKIEEMKTKNKKKLIILKARQLGFSTYKLIEGLDRALFAPNQTCIITAHKLDKLQDLFKKVKYAYDRLENQIRLENGSIRTKPKTVYDNTSELQFDNNSRIKIALDSRSLTPSFLHITELAFVREAKDMMSGTLPSIPENAWITIETTANGYGDYFHELWNKNLNGGQFDTFFVPRYTDPLYISDDEGEGYSSEHIKTVNYLLETEVINKSQWNRYTQKASELGVDVFQEFPSTPEEAFLTTGNPVFDLELVKKLPVLTYTSDWMKDLRIYKEPGPVVFYGVDTSSGSGADYSGIVIRDRELNLYATYQGLIEPDKLCDIIDYLRDKGYKGQIGVENNNTGIATIKEAERRKRYMMLYRETTIDKITQKSKRQYGRNTNSKTRPLMISDIETAVRKSQIKEIDERERSEMFSFVYNTNRKPEAMVGCHDDLIIADAICLQMTKQ